MATDNRSVLLRAWAEGTVRAAAAGAFSGDPMPLRGVVTVPGPRAGALEIDAGMMAGRLLRSLSADNCALLRQFVPWHFEGEPAAFMSGRFLRLEAGWPGDLAEVDIPLGSLGRHPTGGGRWIAGKDELGATVTLGIDGQNPHFLFGGQTGSGKTWAMRAALVQLAQDNDNRMVLIDAKWGDGLGCLGGLPGLVGPVADDPRQARAALAWAAREMRLRYQSGGYQGRVIVGIDEVQELEDPASIELLRKIVTLGRGAGVHVLVGTQHPTKDAFGDTSVKRNLTGRVALKVEDGVASNVVIGQAAPRADHLLGSGDAYAVVPGRVRRLQMAYIPQPDLAKYDGRGAYSLEAWPDGDPADALGRLPNEAPEDHVSGSDEPAEIGAAIEAALGDHGRPWLRDRIEDATGSKPGASKARRLLALGRGIYQWLESDGLQVVERGRPVTSKSQPWVDHTSDVW